MSQKSNPLTRGKKQKALALLRHHQPAAAIPLLEQVCRADRRDQEAWFQLAAVRQELGNFEPAAEAYREVVALDPDHVDAHFYLGNTCLALGDGPGAIAAFREVIRLKPDHRQARLNLGALYELQRNFPEAEKCYRAALRQEPQNPELHYNLGNSLHGQQKYVDAIEYYRDAIRLHPAYADAYNNCGNSLAQLERYDESLTCYRQALQINPRLAAAHNNIGNTFSRMHRAADAMAAYERALQIDPHYAEALTNLGNVKQKLLGNIEEGIACHRRAIAHNPAYADAHYNLAFCLLLKGEFHEGWREYDWRWKREGGARRPLSPTSQGDDLNTRPFFIHAEQGIGDELFFLRFLPILRKRGANRVTYRATTKIAPLLANARGIDRIAGPDEQPEPTDFVCSVGDLPLLLDMASPVDVPPAVTLIPSPDAVAEMRRMLATCGAPPYLGVTWRAGVKGNEMVLYKESPIERMARMLRDVPATVLILQRFPSGNELQTFQNALGRPSPDFSSLNERLQDMLALLSLLDEYVGVPNTNMHLRAAVGKTAKVLVPAPPEWRWMDKGMESPWFPGFLVCRQEYHGCWDGAFETLTADLRHTFKK